MGSTGRASAIIGAGTLVSRVTGLLRTVVPNQIFLYIQILPIQKFCFTIIYHFFIQYTYKIKT